MIYHHCPYWTSQSLPILVSKSTWISCWDPHGLVHLMGRPPKTTDFLMENDDFWMMGFPHFQKHTLIVMDGVSKPPCEAYGRQMIESAKVGPSAPRVETCPKALGYDSGHTAVVVNWLRLCCWFAGSGKTWLEKGLCVYIYAHIFTYWYIYIYI